MLLKPHEINRIKAKFPNHIAIIIPKFVETEGQLYDYTEMKVKPDEFYNERMKPLCSSTMITMKRGPKRMDGSYPSFDIPIWPPIQEGGTRTDACGAASNQYPPDEILEALIENSQYNIGYELVLPGADIPELARATPSDSGINIPSMGDQLRAEAEEATRKELAEADAAEAKEKADSDAKLKARMNSAKKEAPPRETAKERENKIRRERRAKEKPGLKVMPDVVTAQKEEPALA